jgi:hypothetical protein
VGASESSHNPKEREARHKPRREAPHATCYALHGQLRLRNTTYQNPPLNQKSTTLKTNTQSLMTNINKSQINAVKSTQR